MPLAPFPLTENKQSFYFVIKKFMCYDFYEVNKVIFRFIWLFPICFWGENNNSNFFSVFTAAVNPFWT